MIVSMTALAVSSAVAARPHDVAAHRFYQCALRLDPPILNAKMLWKSPLKVTLFRDWRDDILKWQVFAEFADGISYRAAPGPIVVATENDRDRLELNWTKNEYAVAGSVRWSGSDRSGGLMRLNVGLKPGAQLWFGGPISPLPYKVSGRCVFDPDPFGNKPRKSI